MCSSIIGLAHNLGLTAVAEGVGIVKMIDRLVVLSCDEDQGSSIARPMPLAMFLEWARLPEA